MLTKMLQALPIFDAFALKTSDLNNPRSTHTSSFPLTLTLCKALYFFPENNLGAFQNILYSSQKTF